MLNILQRFWGAALRRNTITTADVMGKLGVYNNYEIHIIELNIGSEPTVS